MTPTYIIESPPGTGRDPSAAVLANALGCTEIVAEWDGVDDLYYGALAFISSHHTPPFGACIVQIADADDLHRMAQALITLEINPPHVDQALKRVTLGLGNDLDNRRLATYIDYLRDRCAHAERPLSRYNPQNPHIITSTAGGAA